MKDKQEDTGMRKEKSFIVLILVTCLVLSLTACGNKSATKDLTKDRNKDTIYCFTDEIVIGDDEYDEAKVVSALTEFSLRLFEENLKDQGEANVLISPTSVITAFGMTTFGAKGNTLAQMQEVFGVKRGELTKLSGKYMNNDSKVLKLANSVWFTNDDRLTVKDEFLQFNEEFYSADIYEAAFNAATCESINKWVEKKTDGMIKDILDEIPADAVMYLINALAFESEWAEQYKESDIWKDAKFTTSEGIVQKVDLMCSEEALYLVDEEAKGFIKQYKDRNYAFVALLPNEGVSVEDYVKNLSADHLQNMLSNPYKGAVVKAYLPQFSHEYNVEMSDLLKGMGMTDAFDGKKADFTDMAISSEGNIFINRVIHKTFIEVSPVGTKAGAATVVEMMNESAIMYDEVHEVRLDRPFLYMIIDCENNMPLFIGTVNSVE